MKVSNVNHCINPTPSQYEQEPIILFADYNECENTKMCHHGRCVNMDGTYRCVCNTGYRLSADNRACIGQYLD